MKSTISNSIIFFRTEKIISHVSSIPLNKLKVGDYIFLIEDLKKG